MYIEIKASDIQAFLDGGSKRTVQRGTKLVIDAIKLSYDPDVADKEGKTGINFHWKCVPVSKDGKKRMIRTVSLVLKVVMKEIY